ncbi:MAG TPA: hypothetical protein P5292_14335, partial [Bacteroidia bacterium]|nr:hypothetical protein [Bacteroidia bacterium]
MRKPRVPELATVILYQFEKFSASTHPPPPSETMPGPVLASLKETSLQIGEGERQSLLSVPFGPFAQGTQSRVTTQPAR